MNAAAETVTVEEWWRVAGVALVLVIITSVPYLVGAWASNDAMHFSGFILGVQDGFSYIAKMRLGVQGEWQFRLFYTSEPHDSAPLTFLPYILPGQVVGLFLAPDDPRLYTTLVWVYHSMRVLFGTLLIFVTYRFIAAFVHAPAARLTALIVASAGGGLGWVLFFSGGTPPELLIPEGFSYMILFSLPHLALARAAMLAGLLCLFSSQQRRGVAVLAGLLWLVTGLAVPFFLVVIYAVLGAWGLALLIRTRAFPLDLFLRCLIAGGITLPLFFYFVWLFQANPAFAQWSAQNLLASPPPRHYLLAYGPLLVFAGLSLRWVWQRAADDERWMLLLGWPLIVPVLVYLPINVQRRLSEAVVVPLAILAVIGLERSIIWAKTRFEDEGRVRLAGQTTLYSLVLPSTLIITLFSTLQMLNPNLPAFLPAEQIGAYRWLEENAPDNAVVVTTIETGNPLPAYANLRPYLGHGPETLHSDKKLLLVPQLFRGQLTEPEQDALFAGASVNNLPTADPVAFALLGPGDQLDGYPLIFEAGEYAIYDVRPPVASLPHTSTVLFVNSPSALRRTGGSS